MIGIGTESGARTIAVLNNRKSWMKAVYMGYSAICRVRKYFLSSSRLILKKQLFWTSEIKLSLWILYSKQTKNYTKHNCLFLFYKAHLAFFLFCKTEKGKCFNIVFV